MEYSELFKSALQALRTNILRTSLTMLGIIIGISAVILISSVGQSAVKFVTNEITSFGTNLFQITPGSSVLSAIAGGSGNPLTLDDVNAIKEADIPNLGTVAPLGFASRVVAADNKKLSTFIYGFTPEANELLKLDTVYGDNITDSDTNSRVAVIGSDISNELFGVDVDPVGQSVKIDDAKYQVIGVTHSTGVLTGGYFNRAVSIPLEVLNRDITGNDELYEIDISVIDPNQLNETIANVEEFLREHREINPDDESDFTITSVEQSLTVIQTITGILTLLIAGISSISLIVGGVGVMNIMLVSVTERTKEIGLLKAIGAKERDILAQFLIESVVMTLTGGVIGIIIGVTLSVLIAIFAGLPVVVSIPWILITVVVSTTVGVVFGLYPARRASKLSPIDALRYE